MNVEKEQHHSVPELNLPAYGYTPQAALRHTSLAEVGIDTVKDIAKKYSPKAFQTIKDIPSERADLVSEALLDIKGEHTRDFIGSIFWIHRLVEAQWTDRLEQGSLKILSSEDVGAFCWRVLQSSPKEFTKAVDQLCSQDLSGGRSYFIFKPRDSDSRSFLVNGLRQDLDVIRALCSDHGQRQGYGEYLRVAEYENDDVIGYSIEHGSYRRGSVKIDPNEKAVPMMTRDIRHDLVFYHSSSKSIWVSCASKDADYYRNLLERSLFGESGCFVEQMVFSTDFLKSDELGPLLNKARAGIGSSLRIVSAVYKDDDLDPMGVNFKIAKKGECLVWAKYKKFNEHRRKNDGAHEVKIHVNLLDAPKVHDVITIQKEKIFLGKYLTEEQALTILVRLGVLKVHSNA